jgi:hypothetical protein
LECVGTGQSTQTAINIARAGSMVGFVGVPHGVELPTEAMSAGPSASAAAAHRSGSTSPSKLEDVLAERINPGRVLDYETDLEGIGAAYAAMDERRAIKSLVRVGSSDGRLERGGAARHRPGAGVADRAGPPQRRAARPNDDLGGCADQGIYVRAVYGAGSGWHRVARSSLQARI